MVTEAQVRERPHTLDSAEGEKRSRDLMIATAALRYAWFPSLRIRSSVPVSPLSVAKVRKNYVHP